MHIAHGTRNYFHDKNLNSLRNEAIEGVSSCYYGGVEVMYVHDKRAHYKVNQD